MPTHGRTPTHNTVGHPHATQAELRAAAEAKLAELGQALAYAGRANEALEAAHKSQMDKEALKLMKEKAAVMYNERALKQMKEARAAADRKAAAEDRAAAAADRAAVEHALAQNAERRSFGPAPRTCAIGRSDLPSSVMGRELE